MGLGGDGGWAGAIRGGEARLGVTEPPKLSNRGSPEISLLTVGIDSAAHHWKESGQGCVWSRGFLVSQTP